ncbi:MAG: isoprenylcysteine carboxylmethyltransferase family protein [Candidatus Thiodiazotropha sp.]
MLSRLIEFRPPRIAQLLIAVAVLWQWLFGTDGEGMSEPYLGVALGLVGFAIMLWGWALFKRFDTAICPTATNRHLVTMGIYRFSRNPMYLGILLMMGSLALMVGSLPFYLAALVYFLIINGVFCPYEERKLEACFGDRYLDYKLRVRRWL